MALSETHRREYLEVMGIQSYFPRFILAGAKESNPLCLDDEILESCTSTEPAVTPSVVTSELSLVRPEPALELKVEKLKKVEKIETLPLKNTVERNSDEAADNKEIRFQFAFIRISDKLCILNQIPYVGIKQQLSTGHKNLLLNILRAFQLNTENPGFDAMTFRWPLVEGEHVDKSEGAARSALNSYLEQQMAEKDSRLLLIMGSLAARYTLPEEAQGELESGTFHQLNNQVWKVAKTRSLDEILSMPQVKKEVWQQLLSLNLHTES